MYKRCGKSFQESNRTSLWENSRKIVYTWMYLVLFASHIVRHLIWFVFDQQIFLIFANITRVFLPYLTLFVCIRLYNFFIRILFAEQYQEHPCSPWMSILFLKIPHMRNDTFEILQPKPKFRKIENFIKIPWVYMFLSYYGWKLAAEFRKMRNVCGMIMQVNIPPDIWTFRIWRNSAQKWQPCCSHLRYLKSNKNSNGSFLYRLFISSWHIFIA